VFLIIYVVQGVGFTHAVYRNTEHFYDLTGSLSFIGASIAAASLAQPLSMHGLVVLAMVIIWALRLGSFLFVRVREVGEDQRFRQIKTSKSRFALVWTLQGLWVSLTSCAALTAALAAKPMSTLSPMAFAAIALGTSVWLLGFVIEVVADRQKASFRRDPANAGQFIQTGLWHRSRHPNYWGEIMLWLGVAITASPALQGLQWLVWISPLFVYLLLTRVSGIPTLEKRAKQMWGSDPDYHRYVAATPRLFPKLFG
jgi:steroid 5-alpha reductase family enzyme